MSEGDKVWCENCQAFQPVKRAANDDDCFDLLCVRCSWVVATVRSRADDRRGPAESRLMTTAVRDWCAPRAAPAYKKPPGLAASRLHEIGDRLQAVHAVVRRRPRARQGCVQFLLDRVRRIEAELGINPLTA